MFYLAVNQDRVHMLGGLEVIVTKLTSNVELVMTEPDKEVISAILNMITMLSSVAVGNGNIYLIWFLGPIA